MDALISGNPNDSNKLCFHLAARLIKVQVFFLGGPFAHRSFTFNAIARALIYDVNVIKYYELPF